MKKTKMLIAILLIIITIILIYMAIQLYKNESKGSIQVKNVTLNTQIAEEIKDVNSYEEYYAVLNAVKKYLAFLSNEDSEAVYALLDKNYIDENKITTENVIQTLKDNNKTEIIVNEMRYEKQNEYNIKYFVKGYLYEYNEDEYDDNFVGTIKREYEEVNIEVIFDKFNATFSIIPK